MKRAIWWIKRDFRLSDNQALTQALLECDEVLPLFVFEEALIACPDYSPMHVWAWQQALADLKNKTAAMGGDVYTATGDLLKVLEKLKKEYALTHIYSHEETGNQQTYERDKALSWWCQQNQIYWTEYPQTGVIRRLKNRKHREPIIAERLFKSSPLPVPNDLKFPPGLRTQTQTQVLPSLSDFFPQTALAPINFEALQIVSETAARADFTSFLNDRGLGYSGGISSPNTAFRHGSRLSVHLAWGTMSLRQTFAGIEHKRQHLKQKPSPQNTQWQRGLKAFASRLHWHDHFIQRLESEPSMEIEPLNIAYKAIKYENDPQKLDAWIRGQTGFPLIDACMRCLQNTGFLNFRMRSMVVSFATFGLHLDWRLIRDPLAQVFLDYEPGIHFSQLQMQAGIVGINTIRVYSPSKQIEDQDPDCKFIKQWVSELQNYTPAEIKSAESFPLTGYVKPIVDFKANAKAMKDQVFAVRKSLEGKKASQKVLAKHGSRFKRPSKKKPANKNRQLPLF